ncbi:N-acetylglucosamine-6-phosphate deacetylase [Phycisphaerales bacterium AB-hyl4]|uniref:N-acetylglucosamine-6-phosphate deacetylase n=1 Tax=Natronomicrosphaera hydrolytica TaxID=3242702 RepID=A0ABV4U474_9BACT
MPDANDTSAGYIDLQVNGYAGVDFNHDSLTPASLRHACERMRADGVEACLATIITAQPDAIARRLARLAQWREQDELIKSVIRGLHIEGPALNPADGFRGAHDLQAIQPASVDLFMPLLEAGGGLVRMVTLAPEYDPGMATIRRLSREGCLVSAGHCDASLDQLREAIDAGLRLYTHLGNGCPMNMHRHDNIIQRCLHLRDALTICFIADGVHVPYVALANYLALTGDEGAVVVTDAMAAAGLGPGNYTLGHWEIEVGEDLAAWAPGRAHLVGSAMTMRQAHANLHEHLGLDAQQITRLTRTNAGLLLDEIEAANVK